MPSPRLTCCASSGSDLTAICSSSAAVAHPITGSAFSPALTHIPGMPQRVAARLRPDGQPVRLQADWDGFDRPVDRADVVDDVVVTPRQPELLAVDPDIAH